MAWLCDLRVEILWIFAEATRRRSDLVVFTGEDGEREAEYLGVSTYRSRLLEMAQVLAPIAHCRTCGDPVMSDLSARYCSDGCRPRKQQSAEWWRDYRRRRKERGDAVARGDKRAVA